ncbi:uncharacterized protein BX663DRAFT_493045 [Cokeromyces recurvatus]|uniref:uncharacterized protein n=1 Tax=Cokeromyces recurvatus TaxID=90255 RepID=UPI002220539D|nr:uncharacterized protein BX663DRAFT_493045 [Cokeromyces recurvatus]KAI7908119.1 hypothetical protein BX663DRAFT_493045 [Cokeromyces recurvatus]
MYRFQKAFGQMNNYNININQEIVTVGMSNIVGSFFSRVLVLKLHLVGILFRCNRSSCSLCIDTCFLLYS